MTEDEERFCNMACKVFNKDGTIRACGRDTVQTLIEAAEQVDSTKNFGDKDIGRMNVDAICGLLAEIKR